jgi:hypothetical protein
VVAFADDHCVAFDRRPHRNDKWVSNCPFHIYIVLGASMLNKEQVRIQDLETIGVLSAVLLFFYLLFKFQLLFYCALAMLLIGLFVKPLARIISAGWLFFAEGLGAFNSKLILSLVFFLFLTPLAFTFRLFTKNPLMIRREDCSSFYSERDHTYLPIDLEKMW